MRWRQSLPAGRRRPGSIGYRGVQLDDPRSTELAPGAGTLCNADFGPSRNKCVRRGIDPSIAMFPVTAESGSPAPFDGTHDSALRRGQRSGMLFPIGFAVATQYVGDFQLGTIHGPVLRSTAPTESSCLIGPAMPGQPVSQLLSLCPTPQRDASPLDRRSHPANGSVDPMESIQTP
jgi:hypothetical protein